MREKETSVAWHDGIALPQGWAMELADIKDLIDAYETMTCVAQTAFALSLNPTKGSCSSNDHER